HGDATRALALRVRACAIATQALHPRSHCVLRLLERECPCAAGESGCRTTGSITGCRCRPSSHQLAVIPDLGQASARGLGCCLSAGPMGRLFAVLGVDAVGVVPVDAVAKPRPIRSARARTPTART